MDALASACARARADGHLALHGKTPPDPPNDIPVRKRAGADVTRMAFVLVMMAAAWPFPTNVCAASLPAAYPAWARHRCVVAHFGGCNTFCSRLYL